MAKPGRENILLRRLIAANHRSVAAFCREHCFPYTVVTAFIKLRHSQHTYPTMAGRLGDLLGVDIEELFPPELYGQPEKEQARLPEYLPLTDEHLAFPDETATEAITAGLRQIELRKLIERIFRTLAPQERLFLRLHFFEGLSSVEIARRLKLAPLFTPRAIQSALARFKHHLELFVPTFSEEY